ncbi:efflux RND transporter permease subunit, partial [Alteromonas sp. 14N.309.X.WAT.G.H12]|uniref:efflux RND transporter permease subunit n=1 Tax=Alteromonas sp. 14N.309.X.WAT.G.H12 TaxID=3120824 RepID=UPI002FD0B560
MHQEHDTHSGIIAWFARNTVAANLLMGFIIIMGLYAYFSIQRQMFPNIELNSVRITVSYPGASPQEIEEGILVKIEEALKDVTEIDRTISRANRNSGSVQLEIDENEELTDVLDKIKARVDGIATFPAGMEPVNITQVEFNQQVIEIPLVG